LKSILLLRFERDGDIHEKANSIGDRRSRALINLHLGRLHYFSQQRLEASESLLLNVLSPIWAGYSAAYMGQFSRAIGTLDYHRRFCVEKNDRSSAATLRAVLGLVLLMAKKNQEAYHTLTMAEQEAKECKNPVALYLKGYN
jgi:hypothetical protein